MKKEEWVAQLEFLAKTSKELSLDLLQALGEFYTQMDFAYRHPSFIGNPFGPEILAGIREAQLRREIREKAKYLRLKKFIRIQKEGDKIICKITKEGQLRVLCQKICHQERFLSEKNYTIVVFDIPEDAKRTRIQLRRQLKKFGFELYQRSVWVSQKNVAEDLSRYIRCIRAQKWVSVFEGKLI